MLSSPFEMQVGQELSINITLIFAYTFDYHFAGFGFLRQNSEAKYVSLLHLDDINRYIHLRPYKHVSIVFGHDYTHKTAELPNPGDSRHLPEVNDVSICPFGIAAVSMPQANQC